MARGTNRTQNVGLQADPELWNEFRQLIVQSGVTINQAIERLVRWALINGIPGVERLEKLGTTPLYTGEPNTDSKPQAAAKDSKKGRATRRRSGAF